MIKPKKEKKCRACGGPFKPINSLDKFCTRPCAQSMAKPVAPRTQIKAKAQGRDTSKSTGLRKKSGVTKGDVTQRTQAVVNAYIRVRDSGRGCISCGRVGLPLEAGHYKTVGAFPELRFNYDNIHGQCADCNRHKPVSPVQFRVGMVERIGEARTLALENGTQGPCHHTIDDLKLIADDARERTKELLK